MDKNSKLYAFTKGIIRENPVLCLILGTCPTLAVTTSASNAIGMGVAATLVLVCSNAVISLMRKLIPNTVRIPVYITVIATFVTIVQMLVKAFAPALNDSLGIFLPLIVVNCIILGRAEAFASKNKPLVSVLDGLGMGIGFTAALLCMGIIRELLGNGSVFGVTLLPASIYTPIILFMLPAGGFFVFGLLIAIVNRLKNKPVTNNASPCSSCPLSKGCNNSGEGGNCNG